MTEPEDDKVAERYRALGREQPPPALDAKILTAARQATQSRRAAAAGFCRCRSLRCWCCR